MAKKLMSRRQWRNGDFKTLIPTLDAQIHNNLLVLSGWIPYSSSLFTSITETSIQHDYHVWWHGWHKAQMGVQYDKYQQAGSINGNPLEESQGWNLPFQTGHHPLLEKHMLFFLLGGGIMGFRIPNLSHLHSPPEALSWLGNWGSISYEITSQPFSRALGSRSFTTMPSLWRNSERFRFKVSSSVCSDWSGRCEVAGYWCGSLVTLQLPTTNYILILGEQRQRKPPTHFTRGPLLTSTPLAFLCPSHFVCGTFIADLIWGRDRYGSRLPPKWTCRPSTNTEYDIEVFLATFLSIHSQIPILFYSWDFQITSHF